MRKAALVMAAMTLLACESKSNEAIPESVGFSGPSASAKVAEKLRLDGRISELDNRLKKVKRVLDLFKRGIKKGEAGKDNYTVIDVLLDINKELKEKMPDNEGGHLVRRSSIVLNRPNLSEECRTIETQLESSALEDQIDGMTGKTQKADRLNYSVKACGTDGNFVSVAEVDWIGNYLEFRVNYSNMGVILREILKSTENVVARCQIDDGPTLGVDKVSCANIVIKLSASELAVLNRLNYSASENVRLDAQADIFENQVLKATAELVVYQDRSPKLDIKTVEKK